MRTSNSFTGAHREVHLAQDCRNIGGSQKPQHHPAGPPPMNAHVVVTFLNSLLGAPRSWTCVAQSRSSSAMRRRVQLRVNLVSHFAFRDQRVTYRDHG